MILIFATEPDSDGEVWFLLANPSNSIPMPMRQKCPKSWGSKGVKTRKLCKECSWNIGQHSTVEKGTECRRGRPPQPVGIGTTRQSPCKNCKTRSRQLPVRAKARDDRSAGRLLVKEASFVTQNSCWKKAETSSKQGDSLWQQSPVEPCLATDNVWHTGITMHSSCSSSSLSKMFMTGPRFRPWRSCECWWRATLIVLLISN